MFNKNTYSLNKYSLLFIFILLLAIAFRISSFIFAVIDTEKSLKQNLHHPDSRQYHAIAEAIATKATFIPSFGTYGTVEKMSGLELSAKRTPGYPLFIALFYFLFGVKFWPVYLAQTLLDVFTVFLVYSLAREVFKSDKIPLIAAFLYSINLTTIHFNTRLFAENLFTFVFTLSILIFIKAFKKGKVSGFILPGILFGLSTLIRPIALYFPAVLVLVLLLKNKDFALRKRLSSIAVILIVFLAVLAPWQYRNLKTFGYYSLTNQASMNLCYWNAALLKGGLENTGRWKAQRQLLTDSLEGVKNPFKQAQICKRIGLEYISKYPFRYASLHLKGVKKTFTQIVKFGKGFKNVLRNNKVKVKKLLKKLYPILSTRLLLEYLLLLIGLAAMCRNKDRKIYAVLFILLILYFVNMAGIVGWGRHRVPITPIYLIITAKGIWETFRITFLKNSKL